MTPEIYHAPRICQGKSGHLLRSEGPVSALRQGLPGRERAVPGGRFRPVVTARVTGGSPCRAPGEGGPC